LPVFSPTSQAVEDELREAARPRERRRQGLALEHPVDRPVEGPPVHPVHDLALGHPQRLGGRDAVLEQDAQRLAEREDRLGDDEGPDAGSLRSQASLFSRPPRSRASARTRPADGGASATKIAVVEREVGEPDQDPGRDRHLAAEGVEQGLEPRQEEEEEEEDDAEGRR
jgi:hypothetical protein